MRVYYITPGGIGGRGGMGGVARYLNAAFLAMKPPLTCVFLDSYGPGSSALMPFYFLAAAIRLCVACATGKADVVHLHMSFRGSAMRKLALLYIARLWGVPIILHVHGSEFAKFCDALSPSWRRRLTQGMAQSFRIVALGESWRRYMIDALGLPPDKVVTIPNGVSLPSLPSRAAGSCRIVALGVLGERKGTPTLLRALASPAMQALPWTAVIAGNGAVEEARAAVEKSGIASRVDLPGWIDPEAAKALLLTADIFVLPSRHEGLPVAILEAMAAGAAVVSTPVGAIAELVLNGETGILVPPDDSAALAEALASLARDPARRQTFGTAGRRRIEEHFAIDVIAARMMRLYTEAAASRN